MSVFALVALAVLVVLPGLGALVLGLTLLWERLSAGSEQPAAKAVRAEPKRTVSGSQARVAIAG
jgi:hypothetical protein